MPNTSWADEADVAFEALRKRITRALQRSPQSKKNIFSDRHLKDLELSRFTILSDESLRDTIRKELRREVRLTLSVLADQVKPDSSTFSKLEDGFTDLAWLTSVRGLEAAVPDEEVKAPDTA